MIPRTAKLSAMILLAPVLLAAVAASSDGVDQFLRTYFNTYAGRLLVVFTTILLCFMSGALWGFVSKHNTTTIPYILSMAPAFFMLSAYSFGGGLRLYFLTAGFLILLPIDAYMTNRAYAPGWWFRFKLFFTIAIVTIIAFYSFNNFILATLALK